VTFLFRVGLDSINILRCGVENARYRDLNSAVPACITKASPPKVTPSYQAGHEPTDLDYTGIGKFEWGHVHPMVG